MLPGVPPKPLLTRTAPLVYLQGPGTSAHPCRCVCVRSCSVQYASGIEPQGVSMGQVDPGQLDLGQRLDAEDVGDVAVQAAA